MNNNIWRYLLGVAVSIILLGVTGWVGHLQGRLNSMIEIQGQRGERLSSLEAQFISIGGRLSRIELLADRIYERQAERRTP